MLPTTVRRVSLTYVCTDCAGAHARNQQLTLKRSAPHAEFSSPSSRSSGYGEMVPAGSARPPWEPRPKTHAVSAESTAAGTGPPSEEHLLRVGRRREDSRMGQRLRCHAVAASLWNTRSKSGNRPSSCCPPPGRSAHSPSFPRAQGRHVTPAPPTRCTHGDLDLEEGQDWMRRAHRESTSLRGSGRGSLRRGAGGRASRSSLQPAWELGCLSSVSGNGTASPEVTSRGLGHRSWMVWPPSLILRPFGGLGGPQYLSFSARTPLAIAHY